MTEIIFDHMPVLKLCSYSDRQRSFECKNSLKNKLAQPKIV